MIKYALRCDGAHKWDAWFPSISGYDDQHARGLVDCPFCGSKLVEKAPMSPSIMASRPQAVEPSVAVPVDQANDAMPVVSQNLDLSMPEPLKAMIAQIKERIEATHDYVGDTFAREVRAMHEGETQERPIYGEATASEVRALIEDDIPVAPLPMLASAKGNNRIN